MDNTQKSLLKKEFQKVYDIEEKILSIEQKILDIQEFWKHEFEQQKEQSIFLKFGVEGLKEHLKEKIPKERLDIRHRLFEMYRYDTRIRYPHNKILKVLIAEYDGHSFGYVNFSEIVKKAKIGKNKASQYFAELEEYNYIISRWENKNHLFKINARIIEDELRKKNIQSLKRLG